MTEPTDSPASRQHYWDAARGGLMLLGIPYHAALAYRTGGWIVSARVQSPLLGPLAELIHLFRMPAFFLVAGYFAAMLLGRRAPGIWFWGRLRRLGIPFLAALILIVPPMNLTGELVDKPWPTAWAAWQHSTATSGGYWIRHLWFLIVLLYFCAGAAGLVRWWPGLASATLPSHADRRLAAVLPATLVGAALFVGFYAWLTSALLASATRATSFANEVLRINEALGYLPFFLLGTILERAPATLDRFGRLSPTLIVAAVVATAMALLATGDLARFAGDAAALLDAQIAIAVARTLADRPSVAVTRLVDAAFVIYLLHLPIVILLVGLLRHVDWPPVAGFATVCALTLAVSYAAARIVARVALLDLLFNGRSRR